MSKFLFLQKKLGNRQSFVKKVIMEGVL